MKIHGPMRKRERHPVFCDGCGADLTYKRPSGRLCHQCAYRYSTIRGSVFAKYRPLAREAISVVRKAVASGALPKLDGSIPCVDCGKPARNYDHRDYRRPLHVEPVCVSCNKQRGTAEPYASNPPAKPSDEEIKTALVAAGLPPVARLRGLRAQARESA